MTFVLTVRSFIYLLVGLEAARALYRGEGGEAYLKGLITAHCETPLEANESGKYDTPLPRRPFDNLAAIVFKARCQKPEAFLWYKNGQAVRVNPYYLSRVLISALEDIDRPSVKLIVARLVAELSKGASLEWPKKNVLVPPCSANSRTAA
ncbi:Envelope glycoprotein L [Cacatuid alphaherpesvirus 2]|uniref:Envelope glycoprotein L n=1 Tax=Cacatuid alphaherpesvirus 2 TaxID=2604840 RepID=A0A5B9R2K3_9ALPH|nr:Envelope glycoprotein L [Cacatuid alphaherpesvirus 2]QEG54106.1 Envelope glycoprotein L [Cacatuid alphaherpesvirus 2]